jgi:hypothetical protein
MVSPDSAPDSGFPAIFKEPIVPLDDSISLLEGDDLAVPQVAPHSFIDPKTVEDRRLGCLDRPK